VIELIRKPGKLSLEEAEKINGFGNFLKGTIGFYKWAEKRWAKWKVSLLLKNNKKRVKILDAGCGLMIISSYLVKEAKKAGLEVEVIGIDKSKSVIDELKKRAANKELPKEISFIRGEITNLPFRNNSFDLVIGDLLFYFLDEKELMQFFEETYRVLVPDGQFHFINPNRNIQVLLPAYFLYRRKRKWFVREALEHTYTPNELQEMFSKSSFVDEEITLRTRWFGTMVEILGRINKIPNKGLDRKSIS
jgi:ubiquinone/menaquinone biosynthesis C-methylase UbiE